jgi:hypothetical protein
MLTAAQLAFIAPLILVADRAPQFEYQATCRGAIEATKATGGKNENACLQDERAAQATLHQDWQQFSSDQKKHCLRLQSAGRSPSYVELLTCVELGKAVKDLKAKRSPPEGTGCPRKKCVKTDSGGYAALTPSIQRSDGGAR